MHREITASLWADFLSVYDFLLLPFYLIAIYRIIFWFCNKHYPIGHPWRKYFLAGITAKIAGAIFIGLVYQYYYHGGDTSAFFYHAKVINSALKDSPTKWLGLIFHIPSQYNGAYSDYISQMMWYSNMGSYIVCVLAALVAVLTFNTYLPAAVIFAALAFTGSWALFRVFARQYPKIIREVAIAILFIPSIVVWGSSIFKDTICLAALGWMTYTVFKLIIERKLSWQHFLTLAVCIYLIAIIKVYILLAFAPALLLWISFVYTSKIKFFIGRLLVKLILVASCIAGFVIISSNYEAELGRYSLDNLASTSTITREYIYQVSMNEDASAYDLGAFDPTLEGMLKVAPKAINVTLFRPYLWEARKSMVLLNAIEASLILLLTLKVLLTVGPFRTLKAINNDPNIQFFLIFAITFAFSVGISSYNFGALSRYRIPCLPFYLLSLILIYYRNKPEGSRFFTFQLR